MKLHGYILLGCAALVLGCRPPAESTTHETVEESKPPMPVEAMIVEKSTLQRRIHASGVASGIREVTVVAETGGRIEEVGFRLGQPVAAGRVLVQVDRTVQKAALEQAEKAAESTELALRVTEKLYKEGNASEAELTGAQARATGARAALEQARKAYNDCRITAPIPGYIAQKGQTIEKHNTLAPGTVVARIVDISRLTATVPVGEMEVGMLRKAMNATVRVPAVGNQEFDGTVRAIAAGSDPASGSYPVEVLWRNTPRHSIKSGMSVRVTIHTQSPDSVLLIPAGAVATVEHKDAVFLASASQAAVRFVSLGRTAGNLIEAIEGIHEGDTLVTTGLTALARGRKLKPTVVGSSGGPQ